MNSLDRLVTYLGSLERRLRLAALSRGAAVTATVALAVTIVAVLIANGFAFSAPSVLASRLILFLSLAFALALALIVPLIRLNRRRAAREAEHRFPQFEERLLTFTERLEQNPADPFLPLLAADSLAVANHAEPRHIAAGSRIAAFSALGLGSLATLIWLCTAGPGFLGYGSALLWGGVPRGGDKPFYDVVVEPGNRTVRKRSDQVITARLVGFRSEHVRLMARYASSSKWEQAAMRPQPDGPGFEFLLAGVPESLEYYVDAGGVRSRNFRLNVMDLPAVKRLRVTYHYPAWTGQKDAVEDPGGDLRAVEGTTADVAVETDRPLSSGALVLDDGRKIALRAGAAAVPIQKDGLYHVVSSEQGEDVRLSEDYFIEARKDTPPSVRIARPGRDARATPIEEVGVTLDAKDDFGLQEMTLHYSVNGGPDKTLPLLRNKGATSAEGNTTIYLEDFKLVPGDIVSMYATARDARSTTRTDIFFIEAQPFEREYSQSQQAGGGGGMEGGPGGEISQRQKEIIAATWNQIRDSKDDGKSAAENARFLAGVQGKLRDQARSLVNRMRSRQLAGAGQSFKTFVESMDKAIEAMGPATEKLQGLAWKEALAPEQKALQHLLRAEATFREIQVAFGSRGGAGGATGAGRDLEGLFDLELDTEKNQYETGQQSASSDSRQKEVDEALQKLEQLARRQQELAEQQRQAQQAPQQRWEQETLRREAEQLQRQMQQLARNGQGSQQQGSQQQSSGQQEGSQSQQGGRPMAGQGGRQSQAQGNPQLERAMERLDQALRDMRDAAGRQAAGAQQGGAEARRAAERLRDARDQLAGLRREQSGREMDGLVERGQELAGRQRDFADRLRKGFGSSLTGEQSRPGGSAPDPRQMAAEKERMIQELQKLENDIQAAARAMAGGQPKASAKLREALGNMQQEELQHRMKWSADILRRGMAPFAVMREAITTQALDNLAGELAEAQKALGNGDQQGNRKGLEEALSQAERLRRQMASLDPGGQGQNAGQGSEATGERGRNGGQRGDADRGASQPGGTQSGGAGQQFSGQGGPRGGAWNGGAWSALNRGELPETGEAPRTSPEEMERAYREGVRDLARLRQALEGNPELARDVENLAREMRRVDPSRLGANPDLLAQLHARVVAQVEQVELELRRMVDDKDGSRVRSTSGDPAPPGYAGAVAEYFRRLSGSK